MKFSFFIGEDLIFYEDPISYEEASKEEKCVWAMEEEIKEI